MRKAHWNYTLEKPEPEPLVTVAPGMVDDFTCVIEIFHSTEEPSGKTVFKAFGFQFPSS